MRDLRALKDGDLITFGEAIALYGFKEAARMLGEWLKRERRNHRRRPFTCLCGEFNPDQFRESEPFRCKACRRAYNAKRKKELRPSKQRL